MAYTHNIALHTNERESANYDIYDDFKLEEHFGSHGIYEIKIHPLGHSIVKTVYSDLRIYCYFVLVRSGTIYEFNHETAYL